MENSGTDMNEKNISPLQIGFKFWFKVDSTPVLGPGDIQLLIALRDTKNLTKAAALCKFSYKYAWKKIKLIENHTGMAIVNAKKGGYGGGGGVEITPWTSKLIDAYHEIQEKMQKTISELNEDLKHLISTEEKKIQKNEAD